MALTEARDRFHSLPRDRCHSLPQDRFHSLPYAAPTAFVAEATRQSLAMSG